MTMYVHSTYSHSVKDGIIVRMRPVRSGKFPTCHLNCVTVQEKHVLTVTEYDATGFPSGTRLLRAIYIRNVEKVVPSYLILVDMLI